MKRKFRRCGFIAATILCILTMCSFTTAEKAEQLNKAHNIAETARSMGLSENDPIIIRAKELWWEVYNTKTYSEEDLRILATVIHYEAGNCPDRHQQLVAQVVLNRVADSRFPNSIKAVVMQPNQYAAWYVTARPPISQKCYNNARLDLEGKVNCPKNVIYQAQFRQGSGVYEVSKVDTGWWRSTTYFCYG
jgi:hypothetical protein